MNVNGSRFHLLLGLGDWGRCLDGDGAPRGHLVVAGTAGSPATLCRWNCRIGIAR